MPDLSGLRKYAVMFVLVGLMVLFSLASPYFLTLRNLLNLVTQNTYFLLVAVGLAFVMIGGGIDLSVGYQMSLVGVITAMLMVVHHQAAWVAVIVGLGLGTLLGLVNGLIVASMRIFPLIATLATAAIFQGISYLTTQAQTFRDYPADFLVLTKGRLLGMPVDVVLTLVVVILATIIFNETVYGSRLKALGGNEEASRLAGINVRRMKVSTYTLCGFLTAVGTMVMISKANTTNSSFGPGTEFICLTAAIVGGVSFMGGEGSIPSLVAGVFALAIVGNGMQLAGWGTYAQFIVRGVILLGAVAFDEYQKRSHTSHRRGLAEREDTRTRRGHVRTHPGHPPHPGARHRPREVGGDQPPDRHSPSLPDRRASMKPQSRPPFTSTLPGAAGNAPTNGPAFPIPRADVSHLHRKWLDLAYAHRSPAQGLDLYLPDQGDGPFPVILHLHGGAFAMGDKRDAPVLSHLKALPRGYAVASINYRLSGEAVFPAGLQDIKAAIRWLRAHAEQYHLDPQRFAAWGASAGGNYAAMIALTPHVADLDDPSLGHTDQPCDMQAAVVWFGPTDFLQMDRQLAESGLGPGGHSQAGSPESLYVGARITDVPELVRRANPITYVHPDLPPMLIQHGRLDHVVPYQQSVLLAEAIRRVAGPERVELEILEQADHGDPLFETDENLGRVFAFLDRHLR